MDEALRKKLGILADAAKYDASCASSAARIRAAKVASNSAMVVAELRPPGCSQGARRIAGDSSVGIVPGSVP